MIPNPSANISLTDVNNNFFKKCSSGNINLAIGSEEGKIRSTATYKSIRIYTGLLNNSEYLKNLTRP